MSKFNLDRVIANIEQVKTTLPKIIANDAQRFFLSSWDKQGFTDVVTTPWAPRKKETKKTKGKSILVGTGRLRRAVSQSAKIVTFEKIKFEVNLPYAAIHNYGGNLGNGGKMPKREFMGDSKTLRDLLEKKINLVVEKIWRV